MKNKENTAATREMLVLLSTAHCALCEQALEQLMSMPELRGRALQVLDIAADDDLVHRYGERLPVLLIGARELDWPFDRARLAALLS